MENKIKEYIKENTEELYKILHELCIIPAPSHHEEKRAEYCKAWFERNGITGAYIDEALNVILPYQANGSDNLSVFAAHTDTVFPDTEPMPYTDDGELIKCPGVGDDTASIAVLMLTAKYFFENEIKTSGVLFVCNSCEEGLGNLKGTRYLFKSFNGRIKKFITFDETSFNCSTNACVGSHRYEVEVLTEGGHSWSDFGKENAIAEISKIINAVYSIRVPQKKGKKASFNVGSISGGTSVNTIAQKAAILCEYRSDDVSLLAFMKSEFERIFKEARTDGVKVNVTLLGERPCTDGVDAKKIEEFMKIAENVVFDVTGEGLVFHSASTDCNIPMSLGIPAIAIGVYKGKGTHTREECLEKASLPIGLEIGIKAALKYSEE